MKDTEICSYCDAVISRGSTDGDKHYCNKKHAKLALFKTLTRFNLNGKEEKTAARAEKKEAREKARDEKKAEKEKAKAEKTEAKEAAAAKKIDEKEAAEKKE